MSCSAAWTASFDWYRRRLRAKSIDPSEALRPWNPYTPRCVANCFAFIPR